MKDIIESIKEQYKIKNDIENENNKRGFKYKLISSEKDIKKIFGNLLLYTERFFYELWENPKSLAIMLLNANVEDIKENLSDFVVNNLYNNVDNNDQLIYIISLILKQEIDNINNDDSCCGIILKEFYKKNEVKYFFKSIFVDIFRKLETTYSSQDLIFCVEKIFDEITIENNNENNNDIPNIDINDIELIKNKYIFRQINLESLNEIQKDNNNEEMKFFIEKIRTDITKNSDIYSNKEFLEKVHLYSDVREDILNYYISSFIQLTDIIDIFFNNLINNFDMMPYSIKCICKIISILINKKYTDVSWIEKLQHLNIFFFDVLLIHILDEPSNNTFINEFLITEKTKNKMQIFKEVLNKIFFGELFRKSDFIPFNYFIIEKFSYVIQFQKKLNDIKLPIYIEQIINNDAFSKEYEYNYFKENPKANIIYRIISFKISELCSLLSNAQKCEKDITINKKLLKKFDISEHKKKLNKLISNTEIDISGQETSSINFSEPETIINCYLFTDLITNKSDKIQNVINYENYKDNYFTLREIKEDNEEAQYKNNIIKIKNLLCGLLYNLEPLEKFNFSNNNLSNITTILNTLKNYSLVNSKISLDNNYIPLNWYINYLFENMKKFKEPFDFNKIINELLIDISKSIKNIPFEDLDIFIEYQNKIKKEKTYYEQVNNVLKDINLNIKAENIIRKEIFVIDLNKNKEELKENEKKYFEFMIDLMNSSGKYKKLFMNKEYNIYYNTIKHFIKNFPNISLFQNFEIDNFKLIEDAKIPEIINSYFYFIKKNLRSKGIVNESNIDDIINKIYDYIFENLYNKLFPLEHLIEDIKIFQNCYKHQWIEMKHLFKVEKNYVLDNFLLESINYLKKFDEEKSPRKKMENLEKIFHLLFKVGNFSKDEVQEVDDELALLTIVIVKSQPIRLFSNIKYCELFYVKGGFMANIFTKLLTICNKFMKDLNENDFYNINKNEYEYNIKNNIINKNNE